MLSREPGKGVQDNLCWHGLPDAWQGAVAACAAHGTALYFLLIVYVHVGQGWVGLHLDSGCQHAAAECRCQAWQPA